MTTIKIKGKNSFTTENNKLIKDLDIGQFFLDDFNDLCVRTEDGYMYFENNGDAEIDHVSFKNDWNLDHDYNQLVNKIQIKIIN